MDVDAGGLPATVRLAFPPEPRLLGTIRLVVGIVARKAGMGAEGIEDLKVAVSETCAVAVGDLNKAGRPDPIEVDLVNKGSYHLLVNMEKVDFLDSTGLGVLVGGLKRVRAHDGSLELVCTQERILKIFRITGLTKVFGIYASVEEAKEAHGRDK